MTEQSRKMFEQGLNCIRCVVVWRSKIPLWRSQTSVKQLRRRPYNAWRVICIKEIVKVMADRQVDMKIKTGKAKMAPGERAAETQMYRKDTELMQTKATWRKTQSFGFKDLLRYHCQDNVTVSGRHVGAFKRKTLKGRNLRCPAPIVRLHIHVPLVWALLSHSFSLGRYTHS